MQFEVHAFLTHCFIPNTIRVNEHISITPFSGVGVMDVAQLIDEYLDSILYQPLQPEVQKRQMSEVIQGKGASLVARISQVEANDYIQAINETEELILSVRDLVSLRQLQRGVVAGFLVVQTDVFPVRLHSYVRPPFAAMRKVHNLPIFESESDITARIFRKVQKHSLLRVYLALFADTVAYSDTLVTILDQETRLLKTWSLLETMASSEKGSKKQKVRALFERYEMSTFPDYDNAFDWDLLDIAYKWRNIIVHCGSCEAATRSSDIEFREKYRDILPKLLKDINQACRTLIHAYANALPD
jgi:hypothetical protein